MNFGIKNRNRFWHIMYLPGFGDVDENLLLNITTILVFMGIYIWHMRHDHAHRNEQSRYNEALLGEVREIKEEVKKIAKN